MVASARRSKTTDNKQVYRLSMILSENRFPLFGIMLYTIGEWPPSTLIATPVM